MNLEEHIDGVRKGLEELHDKLRLSGGDLRSATRLGRTASKVAHDLNDSLEAFPEPTMPEAVTSYDTKVFDEFLEESDERPTSSWDRLVEFLMTIVGLAPRPEDFHAKLGRKERDISIALPDPMSAGSPGVKFDKKIPVTRAFRIHGRPKTWAERVALSWGRFRGVDTLEQAVGYEIKDDTQLVHVVLAAIPKEKLLPPLPDSFQQRRTELEAERVEIETFMADRNAELSGLEQDTRDVESATARLGADVDRLQEPTGAPKRIRSVGDELVTIGTDVKAKSAEIDALEHQLENLRGCLQDL